MLSWGSEHEPTGFQSLRVFPLCPVWFSVSVANFLSCQKMVSLPPYCKHPPGWEQETLKAVSFSLWQIFWHRSWSEWHVMTWTSAFLSAVTISATGNFAALWWVLVSVATSVCLALHEHLLKLTENLSLQFRSQHAQQDLKSGLKCQLQGQESGNGLKFSISPLCILAGKVILRLSPRFFSFFSP